MKIFRKFLGLPYVKGIHIDNDYVTIETCLENLPFSVIDNIENILKETEGNTLKFYSLHTNENGNLNIRLID